MAEMHKSALVPPVTRRGGTARGAAAPVEDPWDLENGDRLTSAEFLRRYEAAPGLKKAQLIEGIVHMPSPVRADLHAEPDGLIQLWLGLYSIPRPELKLYPHATLLLDAENTVQPDATLCSAPRDGGRVWLNDKGYLCGAPELVCEITASSAAVDLHEKFRAYRRNGVREYLVWMTREKQVRWFHLVEQDYMEQAEEDGVLSSLVFPGLVLDVKSLLEFDKAGVASALQDNHTG